MATSILKTVGNTANRNPGVRAVICAQEKTGKTTLLASTPKPLLVPLEEGTAGVFVDKTDKIESFVDLMGLMDEIIAKQGAGYKSICFDGAVGIENLIHRYTVESDYTAKKDKNLTMESSHGGYGKAYVVALEHFKDFLSKCDVLANNGINIFIASHVFASKVVDPTAGEYDSWDLLMHSPKNNKTFGKREFITQWADLIGFMYEPKFVTKKDNMNMAVSKNNGQRSMGLSRTAQYVAGNRYGIEGEILIPKVDGWNAVALAIGTATNYRLDYRNVPV